MSENLLKKEENKKMEVAKVETGNVPSVVDSFSSASAFAETWKIAGALAKSQLIPQNFQGKTEDCVIAIDMSRRMGASPFMVLQNMYIVYGKPAWSSQFLIACLNSCRKFSSLKYKMTGEKGKDSYGCIAWATELSSGEVLESPEVTIGMAKAEGWFTKNGSKWKTMADLMLRYRAATLFARLYAPELTFGMSTEDEVIDVAPVVTESRPAKFEAALKKDTTSETVPAESVKEPEKSDLEKVSDKISETGCPVTAEQVKAYVESRGEIFAYDMVAPNLNRIAEAILSEGASK